MDATDSTNWKTNAADSAADAVNFVASPESAKTCLRTVLLCRVKQVAEEDGFHTLRSVFAAIGGATMRQSWMAKPEADFTPAVVKVAWQPDALLVFASLEDNDIYSNATGHNQRMWELGDVLELFLRREHEKHFIELQVTPNNYRLQLRFPTPEATAQARTENRFDHLMLPDGVFFSKTWLEPESRRWFVFAKIPCALLGLGKIVAGAKWRFSFSRYDYLHGRPEPIISSTSAHAQPDFHRLDEWGTLIFI